jgi:hypothetical protein
VGGAFGLLLVVHLAAYGMPQAFVVSKDITRENVKTLKKETLPKDLKGWQINDFSEDKRSVSNAFGEFSKVWSYKGNPKVNPNEGIRGASVSVDYPFPAWHELSQCYHGAGWELDAIKDFRGEKNQPAYYCEQKMRKSGLLWGYLLFCQIDSTGQALTPPVRGVKGTLYRQQNLLTRFLVSDPELQAVRQVGSVYQFQLFVESFAPITEAEQTLHKERFFEAYQAVKGPLFQGVK